MALKISMLKVDPDLRAALEAIARPVAGIKRGSKTYDAPSLDAYISTSTTVTVPGAALGDFVVASVGVDSGLITLAAHVSAADTVTVVFTNHSDGALDLASTTIRVAVIPEGNFVAP